MLRAWLPAAPARGKLLSAARWVVTLLAFWVVVRSIDLGAVIAAMGGAAPLGLGLIGFVVAAQFALLVWRWQFVIRLLCGQTVGFGALALMLGQSFLIGQALPSSIGGDVARVALLSRSTGAVAATRSVVCDRLLGFAGLAVILLPTIPVILAMIGGRAGHLMLTIGALGTVAAVALILGCSLSFRGQWLARHLATIAGDLLVVLRSGRLGLMAIVLAIGGSLFCVLLIYVIGGAIGADLQAWDCLVLAPSALLVSALPISLGGWGVREGALIGVFSLVHADPAGVAAISVIFGLTSPLVGALTAAIGLLPGWRDLPEGSRNAG
ncbi:MAG: flippase-like domain-containing protein [Alphaproteobacteria bacterium]|nr:flippase-like domain-containing protein [Alphaproteobacteria bacterium]